MLVAWAAVLACAPAAARALTPRDVLIVANANAEGSEPLARYYGVSRGMEDILDKRIVVLRTTAGAFVGRAEYNQNIRDPIRQFLTDHGLQDQIKCIALVWGVPVRVLGTELTARQRELTAAYRSLGGRLNGRLAADLALLRTVAVKFPAPRGDSLEPVGELFEPGIAVNMDNPPEFASLKQDFLLALPRKAAEAAQLKDPPRRDLALRQIAALRLDAQGLAGLLADFPPEGVPGVGSKARFQKEQQAAQAELKTLAAAEQTPRTADQIVALTARLAGAIGAFEFCDLQIKRLDTEGEDASVDSELAVLWDGPKNLSGPLPNPLNWRIETATTRPAPLPDRPLMTARIDGPTAADALRIVKDSLAAEKTGIQGTFYIDAGGKYPAYDQHLLRLAKLVKQTRFPVVLDEKESLFPPGSCPGAAMYVGWYSLRKYVPAFTWSKGAVGWHIASFEAQHLRTPSSTQWCPKMIQNGVAATCGAVNEPYLGAFPPPQEFFALLLTGHYTIAECYWRTVPDVSWRLTLIADPLYNPFKVHPYLSIYVLPKDLVGQAKLKAVERR